VHKQLGGGTAGTADPNWPHGYPRPYGTVFSNKNWEKKEGGDTFHVMAFVFPSNHYT